jgi:hypothetical protein
LLGTSLEKVEAFLVKPFEPQLTLFREKKKGQYSLHSVTMTPHGCYFSDRVLPGAPSGIVVIPEAIPFQLLIGERRSQVCPMVITPVTHQISDVRLSSGKTSVVCFVVLNGAVVGSASVSPTDAHLVHAAPLAAAAAATDPLEFEVALRIVLDNVPNPENFTDGDTSVTLRKLGIVDATFSTALKNGIGNDLPAPLKINPAKIKASSSTSLGTCVQSVVANAV